MCWKSPGLGSSSGTVLSPISESSLRGIAIASTCTRAANTSVNTATSRATAQPNCKDRFRHDLCRDLQALDAHNVPPAPVHLSNSTDPLQPLEQEHHHTLFVLEKLVEHRHRFSSVTLLTKNPAVLMDDRYVQVLHRLGELPADHPRRSWFDAQRHPPLRLECSLAFHNDEHRRLLEPAAPSVESRMKALRLLRKEGFSVFLRIDPLFPRDPLGGGKTMADFDLPDVQSIHELAPPIFWCYYNQKGQS